MSGATEFRLETERLAMRDWREDDLDDFHRLHVDQEVMATLGPLKTREETAALIADLQGRSARNGGYTYWPLERQEDSRVVGFCGLDRGYEGPIVGELEIGWRIASDCWRRGYAAEAARACLAWAGANFPHERVVAITARINQASRGLMGRLGMQYRPDMDFDHPKLADGDPLRPHVTYVKEI
ncbi:GNAT family N-acetyltransferase [Altererythrobacter sp. ZODW24]|uniref:GNAT family N-acetyltransferase n=1 Tax=Altererythrobacter sp. ZODW24 TaxID=2185142 RepID=UPI000DF7E116|nr:GNAT family N-acetyltransferase [Altererythrobacter sp. ZODW24]